MKLFIFLFMFMPLFTMAQSDTLVEPDLTEYYFVRPLLGIAYTTRWYAEMRGGKSKLIKHIVKRSYPQAASDLIINASVHKEINKLRKNLGLNPVSNSAIYSDEILSDHQDLIWGIMMETKKPTVMRLIIDAERNCNCSDSIFYGLISDNDIKAVIESPETTSIRTAYYQISVKGEWKVSYTLFYWTGLDGKWNSIIIEHQND